MEPQQNSKKVNSLVVLLILAIAIVGGYYWFMASESPEAVSEEIRLELNSADMGDLEVEMNSLNEEINQL